VSSVQVERWQHRAGLLLIRGFGVRVPGGAPVLTWGNTPPGLLFSILRGTALRPSWGPYGRSCLECACGYARPGPGRRPLPRRSCLADPAIGFRLQLGSVPDRLVKAWASRAAGCRLGAVTVRVCGAGAGGLGGRAGGPDGLVTVAPSQSVLFRPGREHGDGPPAAAGGAGCRGPGTRPGPAPHASCPAAGHVW
jgi:hypothetical protein